MTTPTYQLQKGKTANASYKDFLVFIKEDTSKLWLTLVIILISSATNMVSPYLVSKAVDSYISVGNLQGLLNIVYILCGAYFITLIVGYMQGILVGRISQASLYRLREALFTKLQHLPIAFFNQNKSGDLMSRINNDTDKINQFLSQSISQFIGTVFTLLGIVGFSLYMSVKLTLVMMSVTILLYIITKILSPWIRRENKKNLEAVGSFSASLQENLTNFRVVAAYSKRDYLQNHLNNANKDTFKTALTSGVGNRIFEPIYDFGGAIALIIVLSYGFHLIGTGEISIGILIAFVAYTQRFYDPLRFLATIFGTIQLATAAWGRVHEVFQLKNNLKTPDDMPHKDADINHAGKDLRMELRDVTFAYEGGEPVIENANLAFEKGKTYALVGPTGGGKSTLASLMAHLYDPTIGSVYLNGRNICSYTHAERAAEISVILQDPILFNGTVGENITYGNIDLLNTSIEDLNHILETKGFKDIIERFESGLTTAVSQNGAGLSIGQKQLISFMRAILREPKLLILDEATANIDTVTEALLNKTLEALPAETTKIIIAHRLNTIKEADEIMFVNGHHVTPAGGYENAIKLIADAKRSS
ncbi:MAG: ABC transporter ATP-binding protein [Patescibacteria group bacterium]